MYFSMPAFCPLMVLVFRQNLNFVCSCLRSADTRGERRARPDVAVTVLMACRLFMGARLSILANLRNIHYAPMLYACCLF
jgi:hypothetical protein